MKYLLLLVTILSLWSCKKEHGTPPRIVFTSTFSSAYAYGSEISFQLEASDNEKLTSIVIKIYNLNNLPVLTPISLSPNTNSYTYAGEIEVNDIHLETGGYYIQATASDGVNETIIIKAFQINGAPKELIDIVGLRQNGNNSLQFFTLANSDWNLSFSAPLENFFSHFDNYNQRLLLAGNTSDGMNSLRLDDGAIVGSSATPFPTSTSIWNDATWHASSRLFWMACKDGSVRAYNSQAQLMRQFLVAGNDIPQQIAATDNYIIVYASNISSTQHRIDTYQKTSGSLVHSATLFHPIEQLETLSNDAIWMYQEGESYRQNVYRIQGNYIDEWTNFRFAPSETLHRSLIADGKLFLSYNNAIRVVDLNGNMIAEGNGYSASQLAHEILSNQLFVVTENEIFILNGNTLGQVSSLPHCDHVVFRYNK